MSSINSVTKLQILYFSKKNKKIKNLKNGEKKMARYRHLYILLLIYMDLGLELMAPTIFGFFLISCLIYDKVETF